MASGTTAGTGPTKWRPSGGEMAAGAGGPRPLHRPAAAAAPHRLRMQLPHGVRPVSLSDCQSRASSTVLIVLKKTSVPPYAMFSCICSASAGVR